MVPVVFNVMPFRIRKLTACLALAGGLLLSGCTTDMFSLTPAPPPIQPVSVAEVTTPPPAPDTPPLYCKIGRGSAQFGRDWYDFSDTTFALRRGAPADVNLTRIHNTQQMTIQALFDGSGQKLIFCPFLKVAAPDQRISCFSIYALDEDLQDGIKRTFDIPSAVRGGAITCAYRQERLKPLAAPGGN